MQHINITPEYINQISYTDFVGLINQWNVLPGSYSTLSKWRVFSQLTKDSRLLEIACTTGFSSRELALQSGCSGEGLDISEKSIAMAHYNRDKYAPYIDINYQVADGLTYKSKSKFTHVVVGAALGFFPDPKLMLDHCVDLLADGGYILASPFYGIQDIPSELVGSSQNVFGITPTATPYKEIMKSYKDLEIVYEDRNELVVETEEELAHYCSSTVSRTMEILKINDIEIEKAIYERLYLIKITSNKLRKYQKYSVLVLKYRSDIYPNRYVELF